MGEESVMGAEEPGEEEEGHSRDDKGSSDGAVQPGGEMEPQQGAEGGMEYGEGKDDRQADGEQMCRGAREDEHGHDEDCPDGFEGADDNHGEKRHQGVVDDSGVDAQRKGERGVEGTNEEFFVKNPHE